MNVEEVTNPGYTEAPKKSGGGWFKWLGLGCVGMLILCGIGGAIAYFTLAPQIQMGIEQGMLHVETQQIVMGNETVNEKLGAPVSVPAGFDIPDVVEQPDGSMLSTYTLDVNGANGTGVLKVQYRMKPGDPVERTIFTVEVDGEVIDLKDDSGFSLDIDDGGEASDGSALMEKDLEPAGVGS